MAKTITLSGVPVTEICGFRDKIKKIYIDPPYDDDKDSLIRALKAANREQRELIEMLLARGREGGEGAVKTWALRPRTGHP